MRGRKRKLKAKPYLVTRWRDGNKYKTGRYNGSHENDRFSVLYWFALQTFNSHSCRPHHPDHTAAALIGADTIADAAAPDAATPTQPPPPPTPPPPTPPPPTPPTQRTTHGNCLNDSFFYRVRITGTRRAKNV